MNVVNLSRLFPARRWLTEAIFESVFAEHYARIYRVVYRMVGDRAAADDLTAEAFWKLWESPPPDEGNLGGWLYRVATRLAYNAMRAAKRRTQHEQTAGRVWEETSQAEDPALQAERRMERAGVRATLRDMALRDVQLLMLRHAGLSYAEIASAVGVSAKSVGTLLARAQERFETLYAGGNDARKR